MGWEEVLLSSIMGIVNSQGSCIFNDKEILGKPVHEIANTDCDCHENRDIFLI